MVSIRFQAPALVATLVLLATIALGDFINLLNDIPVNLTLDEGDTFVLKWTWDGAASVTGQLNLISFNTTDTDSSRVDVLEDKLNLTMGSYPWTVKTVDGRKTLDWYYSLEISYDTSGYTSVSGRAFHVKAKASPSSTASNATVSSTSTSTSTTPSATTTGSETAAPQPAPSGSSRLSGGALAGTVVGSLAGGGIFATLIGLVVYYRRKSLREKETASDASLGGDKKDIDAAEARYQKAELAAAGTEKVFYELDGTTQIQEVNALSNPTELDSNARSELDGNGPRGSMRKSK
ncbi:hypothetical protein F4825DRAFT_207629 [Nemania diffusa]|nr:hypothetical protein F4825DRAFT_207629 [Nemania diffusa]